MIQAYTDDFIVIVADHTKYGAERRATEVLKFFGQMDQDSQVAIMPREDTDAVYNIKLVSSTEDISQISIQCHQTIRRDKVPACDHGPKHDLIKTYRIHKDEGSGDLQLTQEHE